MLKAEELQHDDLVTDLMDQNAELQTEARPPRSELAEKKPSPTQAGAPHAVHVPVGKLVPKS